MLIYCGLSRCSLTSVDSKVSAYRIVGLPKVNTSSKFGCSSTNGTYKKKIFGGVAQF